MDEKSIDAAVMAAFDSWGDSNSMRDSIRAAIAAYRDAEIERLTAENAMFAKTLFFQDKTLADLRAKLEAAERDAERYRWLRENRLWLKANLPMLAAQEFDAAIDSARGGERG